VTYLSMKKCLFKNQNAAVGTSNRRLGIGIVVRNFEGHLIVVNCLIKIANLELIVADALVAYQIVGFSK
jgi:hypothetical protein